MEHFSIREQIVEVVNKLFIYTDSKEWDKLQNEVFTEQILFDMSSIGQEVKTTTAKEVCEIWQKGFESLDAVNHLSGNYLITLTGETTDVFAHAQQLIIKIQQHKEGPGNLWAATTCI